VYFSQAIFLTKLILKIYTQIGPGDTRHPGIFSSLFRGIGTGEKIDS
jgi:hypothetical protein